MNISTLIATYRATLKPVKPWSHSKDYWLDFLTAEIGSWDVTKITPQRVTRWAQALQRSAQSRRAMLYTLVSVLDTGRTLWGLNIKVDAVRDAVRGLAARGLVERSKERQSRLSDSELDALRSAWSSDVPSDVIPILVDTAMRSGELVKLTWDDINLTARTAIIRRRKNPRNPRDQMIPLLGRSAELLAKQPRSLGRLFPYTQPRINGVFRAARAKCGLDHVRLHDLRHEGISRLFEKGWSIPQVAAVSGHKDWANLKRYTHISPQSLLELEERG